MKGTLLLSAYEYFMDMLRKYDINYVLDVRSTPYSQFAENYNRENIRAILEKAGIEYSFIGSYFGARPGNRTHY